ncbi:MAG: Rab family GTPase [Promethearchaeota archaeon]
MKKIIFIGPPSAGKTSTRLYFFEDIPISEIIKPLALEPTMGINWFNYDVYDTKLGIVDTSGQEILSITSEADGYLFIGADVIIYMFDVSQYLESELLKMEFMDYLMEIIARRDVLEENYEIYVFVHKVDLINHKKKTLKEIESEIFDDIIGVLKKKFNGSDMQVKIHFTSLHPVLVDSTYELLKKIVQSS